MLSKLLQKTIVILIIIAPLVLDMGCKKQTRCGCGKDVVFEITNESVSVTYDVSARSAYFLSAGAPNSVFYFCNPGNWLEFLKAYPQGKLLLLSGKAYYECNYLMNSSNYGYYIPPTYQVDVTNITEDNYSKK
jgi:hypothetical protein